MSNMVKCDECGKLMYTDSREEKGAYVKMTADDPLYGFMRFHLCRQCYANKFPQMVSPEEEEND